MIGYFAARPWTPAFAGVTEEERLTRYTWPGDEG